LIGRVLLLLTWAAVVGLAVEAPAKPDASAGSSCPSGLVNSAGPHLSPTATVTCVGWRQPAFADGTVPASVLVRDRDPRLGEPCSDVHYYRVTFLRVAGEVRGTFTIFGGASRGSLIVPDDQVTMLDSWDGYVTDVQVGSYEQSREHGRVSLRCDIAPTYQFYCPATREVDELCYTWLRQPS